MKKVAMITGILLILVGAFGYFTPQQEIVLEGTDGEVVETKPNSWTALIPAFVGLPLFVCGLWAVISPPNTRNAMHFAASIGLLGAIAASARGLQSLMLWVRADDEFNARAFMFISLMAILCWIFVAYCVASFMKARQSQASSGMEQS